ncbi:MAG: hypothetical protein GY861_01105 [bacterium]|nr:hypothetical protein [bacterium]
MGNKKKKAIASLLDPMLKIKRQTEGKLSLADELGFGKKKVKVKIKKKKKKKKAKVKLGVNLLMPN